MLQDNKKGPQIITADGAYEMDEAYLKAGQIEFISKIYAKAYNNKNVNKIICI